MNIQSRINKLEKQAEKLLVPNDIKPLLLEDFFEDDWEERLNRYLSYPLEVRERIERMKSKHKLEDFFIHGKVS